MPTTFGTCDKFDAQVYCNGGTLVLAMTRLKIVHSITPKTKKIVIVLSWINVHLFIPTKVNDSNTITLNIMKVDL